jgi:hypothetical protein
MKDINVLLVRGWVQLKQILLRLDPYYLIAVRNSHTSGPHTQILISCRYFLVHQQDVGTFIMLNVLQSYSSLKMKEKRLSTRQR